MLQENEIIARAVPVKYHNIEYHDNYIVLVQNKTRRRVPNGYWFEDTGVHIYLSLYYSDLFQSKKKVREFIVNRITKEWRPFESTIIEKHIPAKVEAVEVQPNKELIR